MAKNWMEKLRKLDGAVSNEVNRFANVIETPSPSVNFSFGKGFGLPRGYSAVFYGPPKGGKSLLFKATAGKLHQLDSEAIVVNFDTEFREEGQLPVTEMAKWGIDPDRYIAFSTNSPMQIFDRICTEIKAMCQDGAPIALIGIDSLNGIMGRRAMNQESIETQQIGDEALTIQTGLKMILPVQRTFNIGLILTAHVRAEMDSLEQKRGNKVRMATSFGTQHHAEYYLYIERNRNKDARSSLTGKEFLDEAHGDIAGNADVTAHKIRTIMKANSMGPAGRVGEFTIDYSKGIINQHEEVFLLGTNRGIIERPNQTMYRYDGKDFRGKEAMIQALIDYPDMAKAILQTLRQMDVQGKFNDDAEESA